MKKRVISWDVPSAPVWYKDTLVLGAPGTGYETMVAAKRGRNISDYGRRPSSLQPDSWIVDSASIGYQITVPWEKPLLWLGYCDNFTDLFWLPWSTVCVINMDPRKYRSRVISYRRKHNLSEIDHINDVDMANRLIALQDNLIGIAKLYSEVLPLKILSDYPMHPIVTRPSHTLDGSVIDDKIKELQTVTKAQSDLTKEKL